MVLRQRGGGAVSFTIPAAGLSVVIRHPTWGDQKSWDADGVVALSERAIRLVKSVDGVDGVDRLTPRAALIVGAFVDKLCVFGPEEGERVQASLVESMDGIYRTWTFTANDVAYVVKEPTLAAFNSVIRRVGPGRQAWNTLAEMCIVSVGGKAPMPGAAASAGVPLTVMNYIAGIVFNAVNPTEEEVEAAHKGAALA